MSGTSNVGNSGVYEAGDQRVPPDSEKPTAQTERYEEGIENSHQSNDSKDQRSIANRLAAAKDINDPNVPKAKSDEAKAGEIDPTLPARMHGNKPSRGAEIDKEIAEEEAAILAKKDAKK